MRMHSAHTRAYVPDAQSNPEGREGQGPGSGCAAGTKSSQSTLRPGSIKSQAYCQAESRIQRPFSHPSQVQRFGLAASQGQEETSGTVHRE